MFARASWIAVMIFAFIPPHFCVVHSSGQALSLLCLGCICDAISKCNTTVECIGSVCGPFAITWDYWSDAGKPTLNNETLSNESFTRCVKDPFCAADAVQNYMARYRQDCNGDGVIDCHDYVRIHRFGAFSCNDILDREFEEKFKSCLRKHQHRNQNQ